MIPLPFFEPRLLIWSGVTVVLAAVTLAAPNTAIGGFSTLGVVAILGGAAASWWQRLQAQAASATEMRMRFGKGWIALGVSVAVVAMGAGVFHTVWNRSALTVYDWAPHHANLANLIRGLRAGEGIPTWVHGVSTGDSTYELYPVLPYLLAAKVAIWTDASDLTLVMIRSAVVIHTLGAVGAALLALRLVAWPWALVVGFAEVFDRGSVWGGGIDGLFNMGVTHSALSNALWPFALCFTLAFLERPTRTRMIGIWLCAALAVGCHPLGLLSALATIAGLVLAAILAADLPARRSLAAALHIALGTLVVAAVWLSASERLTLYAVHFAVGGRLAWDLLGTWLAGSVPDATITPLVFAGYLGSVVGLFSRRAGPTVLAAFVGVLAAGLVDQLYVLLDLVPSPQTARLQTVRLESVSKGALYVLGAFAVCRAMGRLWPQGRNPRPLGAVVALLMAGWLRGAVPYFDRTASEFRALASRDVPDPQGLRELAQWAREQRAQLPPGKLARLLDQDDQRFYSVYHVQALSGLPTVWVGPVSCMFLRERIEDASPQSLRRFGVRWVMRRDASPSLGDPSSELQFGRYRVRELLAWDGAMARVERGQGRVEFQWLESGAIAVELVGTAEPALVALGTGYYPRWRATFKDDRSLPVYALPSFPGAKLHVPAAWVPPGRTVFSPDGPLPSDGRGRRLSLASALVMAVALVGSSARTLRRALRIRGLRLLGKLVGWCRRQRAHAAKWAVIGGLGALATLGYVVWRARSATSLAVQVGNGLIGSAAVEIERSDGWRRCSYSPVHGAFRCPGPVLVQDTVVNLLNDAPPSPPFAVPGISVATMNRAAHLRIRAQARLEGEYWAATSSHRVSLGVSGEPRTFLGRVQKTLTYSAATQPREVVLELSVPARQRLELAVVRRDRLDPERGYPAAPDNAPF